MCVIGLIIGLVGTISNSLLVHGARKGKGDLFMFWLVWSAMSLLLSLGILIAYCALGQVGQGPAGFVVTYLVGLLVTAYLWVVVNSYRKELTSGPVEQGMNYLRF
eukprot:GFUD01037324.1.p1 GENE.GFUD01037324.1~~GFUD01037324.1.p1  ORF type:complete len:105 (+),score=22.48 GFUD01037324.1:303-617(+)